MNSKFNAYPKIPSNLKIQNTIKTEDELWVAVEKIHGANFSIHMNDSGEMKYGRRNDFLKSDEFFYNYLQIMHQDNLIEKLKNIYDKLKKVNQQITEVVFFGEIFGGYYPTKNENAQYQQEKYGYIPKRVQKEIHYCPENHIIMFDIMINNPSKHYLEYTELVQLCTEFNVLHCPILQIGTLEEVSKYNHHFITKIPELFQLESVPDNYAEGIIIRPNKTYFTPGHERIIMKKKIESFLETKPKNKKNTNNVTIDVTKINDLYEDMKRYCTKQRYQNIQSHVDPDKFLVMPLNVKINIFLKDLQKEYFLDHPNIKLTRNTKDKISSMLYKDARVLITNLNTE